MTQPTCTIHVEHPGGAIEEVQWVQQRFDEVYRQARRILPVEMSRDDVLALLNAASSYTLTPGVWRAVAGGVILQISETRSRP
ncbi:hypothetical protein [Tsukamurella pulmonis]|uniref:hypothetical protein n=1 Tax=Tsukamurella pulmonis TaxID=47312 RepID=UPI000E09A1B8|nr:hypothetical protein [Tsukamurella pulmonis]RDH13750.1 hypothetical protein DVB88_00805 [Tsukamurella pulmonis]